MDDQLKKLLLKRAALKMEILQLRSSLTLIEEEIHRYKRQNKKPNLMRMMRA